MTSMVGTSKPIAPARRQQERAALSRAKILDAALSEFAKKGFEGASTRAIAAAADVKHSLVTYHFGAKEELWRAVLERSLGHYRDELAGRLEGLRGVDDYTKLRLVQEEFVRFAAKNPSFHLLMAGEANRKTDRLDWLVSSLLRPIFDLKTGLIRSVQREGRFIEGDPYHLQYLFIGASTRIFMLSVEVEAIAGWSPLEEEFVERHVELCMSLFFR